MGMFNAMELLIDEYTEAADDKTRVFLRQPYDILPRHVEAWSRCVDLVK